MTSKPTRKIRSSALAGVALAICGVPGIAKAQDNASTASSAADEASNDALGEIVVTAQKRETNLQKTPVSISVLSSEDLKARGVVGLKDLMDGAVPSLRIAPFASRNSALTVGIRGIVPFDANQPSRDSGVGIYIDGVYLGRSQGLGAALYDIERIEVLKGPQGTLFGRNSTGGALSIVTRKPSGEFHLSQTAGISNFGGYKVETHLDLPSIGGFSFKVDGIVNKRNGTLINPMRGEEDYNQVDQRGLHVGALFEPSSNFSVQYDFDISRDASTPYYMQVLAKSAAIPFANVAKVQPKRVKTADIGVPEQVSLGETYGHALHMDWELADRIHLRSISSYRQLSQNQYDNGGAHQGAFGPNARFARYSLADLQQKQYSQEFQLVGSLDQIEFVAGAYYYHEKGEDWAWAPYTMQWGATPDALPTRLPTLQAGAVSPFPDRASDAVADSLALYGQATWTPAFLDRLHLTAGARYTRDKKHGDLFKVNGASTPYTFRFSDSRVDPTFSVAFDPTDNIHLYAKWGTAYRAGGANSRSITYRAYNPEEVETAEIGFKSELLDRHVRLNLAAYRTIYKDQQIDFNATLSAVPGGPTRTTIETVNARGNGTIKGIEADLTIAPFAGLTLTGSYAYTKGDLQKAPNPYNPAAAPQNVFLVYTPENAFSAAIDYSLPLNGVTLRAHIDASGGDGYHSQSSDAVLTDASFLLNSRFSLADIDLQGKAQLQLSLWSRNLFNEQHTFFKSGAPTSLLLGIYNEPRTYGLEATVRF